MTSRADLLGRRRPASAGVDLAEHLGLGRRPASRSSSVSPHAQDRRHPVAQDRRDLAVDHLVGLAEQLAALAVAGDHVAHVELGQERRRHLAGERALVLPVAVLGAERERRARRPRSRVWTDAEVGERRVDADVDALVVVLRRAR